MMYPLNLFGTDPTSGAVRPFILFMAQEAKVNIGSKKSWKDIDLVNIPKGGFALPFPNGGLKDSVQHTYDPGNPMADAIIGAIPGELKDALAMGGVVPDPMLTQIYRSTAPRKWSGSWDIVPQSMAESAMVALLLSKLKKWAAPDSSSINVKSVKVGVLTAPYTWKIIFGNPVIQLAMDFNDMALESYEIDYFAQGFASTYNDLMPKHITLTMNFAEFGIKRKSDWMI